MVGVAGKPMRSLLRVLLLLPVLWASIAQAQPPTVLVSNGGTEQLCNAQFFDSGFDQDYGPNETHIISFCPGIPGANTQVAFITFDLGPGDQLIIYDGPNTGSPILQSGTQANGLAGLAVFATSGCLTFQFISDGLGQGAGWQALILCDQPCDEPTAAIAPLAGDPLRICIGESISFDGSGSSPAPGRSLNTYAWDLGDGSTASGPSTSTTYTTPGEYTITLSVTDDIGCVSVNYMDVQVRVGTVPDLSGTTLSPTSICVGESAQLVGSVQGTTWTNVPEPIVEGLVILPDGGGATYNAAVTVSGFPSTTTIGNATDLENICFTMEHSYIGDLTVTLTCPSGQSVVLFNEFGLGTGPGNTFLGDPVDPGTGTPGIGFQYCFGDLGTFGPFSVENAAGNWIPSTVTPGFNSMAPGSYQAEQSFANFIGCPLNGNWSITVTDNLFADDGFIFDWGLTIDPALYPDQVQFTPVYGAGPDSTYWTGPDITSTDAGGDVVTVTPPSPGSYDHVYTVIDDFGCTYDTVLTLTVTPGAVIEATATVPVNCGDPVQLNAQLTPPIPQGPIVYQWTPNTNISNPNIPFPLATPTQQTWYVITAFPAGRPLCGSSDSVLVNALTSLDNSASVIDALCSGDGSGSITVTTDGNGGPWNYTWVDEQGNVVQSTQSALGDVFNGSGGNYEVFIAEGMNGNGCEDSLEVSINEPPPVEILSLSNDTLICRTGIATLTGTAQGGGGLLTFNWSSGATGVPATFTPLTTTTYQVWVTDPNNCSSDTLSVDVQVNPPLSLVVPDTVETCPDVDLELLPASYAGGNGQYTFDWGAGASTAPAFTVNTGTSGTYCVTLGDGCETPDVTRCIRVEVTPIPPLELTVDTLLGCDPFTVRFTLRDTTGGATVLWDFGDGAVVPGPPGPVAHTYMDPAVYSPGLTVTWPNGCADDTTLADLITVAAVPNAEFTWSPLPPSVIEPETQFIEQAGPYATEYAWDFAGLGTDTVADPVFSFPDQVGATYPVQLVVTNYLGCSDTALRFVEVIDQFLVFVPNAFTPDGDGINDALFVEGRDIATAGFELLVYNRWGEQVFSTTDRSKGWDGTYNGTPVMPGAYMWRLLTRSAYTGQRYEQLGHVLVVR
jgi:gliding motility-associated-like protein